MLANISKAFWKFASKQANKKVYKIGGQEVVFIWPLVSINGGEPQEDMDRNPSFTIRGPKGYVLIDKKDFKMTNKTIDEFRDMFKDLQVISYNNGSMMTALQDFIKTVSQKVPEQKANIYTYDQSTNLSKDNIYKASTYVPTYGDDEAAKFHKIIQLENKQDHNGGPKGNYYVKAIFIPRKDGNGNITYNDLRSLQWMYPDKNKRGKIVQTKTKGFKGYKPIEGYKHDPTGIKKDGEGNTLQYPFPSGDIQEELIDILEKFMKG